MQAPQTGLAFHDYMQGGAQQVGCHCKLPKCRKARWAMPLGKPAGQACWAAQQQSPAGLPMMKKM